VNPWGFIIACYLVAAAVMVAIVVWLAVDRRLVSRRLATLEARGVRRRSAQTVVAK
jgi:heme exporter protein CcmD